MQRASHWVPFRSFAAIFASVAIPDRPHTTGLCYMSRDFREGMDAFLSKRAPKWAGE
jgi:enoyl-CoA hydratase/carnithine racemase